MDTDLRIGICHPVRIKNNTPHGYMDSDDPSLTEMKKYSVAWFTLPTGFLLWQPWGLEWIVYRFEEGSLEHLGFQEGALGHIMRLTFE